MEEDKARRKEERAYILDVLLEYLLFKKKKKTRKKDMIQ